MLRCAVPCFAVLCHAVQCFAIPCHAVPCPAVPCCARLCPAVPCCAMLCCAVLCCAVLCCAVPAYAVLCLAMLCCSLLCLTVLCCAALPYPALPALPYLSCTMLMLLRSLSHTDWLRLFQIGQEYQVGSYLVKPFKTYHTVPSQASQFTRVKLDFDCISLVGLLWRSYRLPQPL